MIPRESDVQVSLIVPQVKISLATIVQDKDFSVPGSNIRIADSEGEDKA